MAVWNTENAKRRRYSIGGFVYHTIPPLILGKLVKYPVGGGTMRTAYWLYEDDGRRGSGTYVYEFHRTVDRLTGNSGIDDRIENSNL